MDNQEINRRMAEVMGWPAYIGKKWDDMKDIDFVYPHVVIWSEQICYHSDNPCWFSDWNPAENESQAIEVAEELRKRDPDNSFWELDSPYKTASWGGVHATAHLFRGVMVMNGEGGSRGQCAGEHPATTLCETILDAVEGANAKIPTPN